MVSIAVTDAELRHALSITRSVGPDNQLSVFGRARFSTSFFSRFVNSRHRFWNYSELDLKEYDAAYLITDAAVEYGIQEKLENALLPKRKSWEVFRDKSKTARIAKRARVNFPKTDVIEKYKETFSYPVFVKPALSSGSRGGRVLKHEEDAQTHLPELLGKFGKLLVQEFVQKRETIGTEVICKDGQLFGMFQHKRIREFPVSGGPSTLRVSVKDSETRKATERLFEKVKWDGVAMAEFAMTDDGPVLFEVNPRWWGSLELAIKSGIDFPKIYLDLVLGKQTEPRLDWKTGVLCKYLLFGDLQNFVSRRNVLGLIPSLFETKNFDILSLKDPGPALVRPLLALEMLSDKNLNKLYLSR
ncbi:MAG: ATP-grasp domain-containing protein [Candidatus Altiarchaeota archaeon]|nr:ATP-grasp domain-containing protein [Candidatus Altiarchaeota archaeon]